MSFLNFGKDKAGTEHLDTTEIKQAAISDTQLNSLGSSNSQSSNTYLKPDMNSNQTEQNFVNPFTKPQVSSSQENSSVTSSPLPEITSSASDSNKQLPVQQPLNPEPVSPPVSVSSSESKQDLNQLNQNLTQSLQSQESLNKDQIKELIDETVEKVIEEKWDALTEKVDRVLRWKEKKEEEINMLKEDIVNIADGFSKLEGKLINKISNYDKNILDVNSEIKALEKVFQKVTPTLINNVNELSRIADDLKGVEKPKKEDKKNN